MKALQILFFISMIFVYSCTHEQISEEPESNILVGDFTVDLIHKSGIHTFYDSVGYIIGMGYDTTYHDHWPLKISAFNDSDSLQVDALLATMYGTNGAKVKCIVENDTIRPEYDFGVPQTSNDYIRGKIWMVEDSIFLDYVWDKRDIWSYGALPVRGHVLGRGVIE